MAKWNRRPAHLRPMYRPFQRQSANANPVAQHRPIVQQLNNALTPHHPVTAHPAIPLVQGLVLGVQGDLQLAQRHALAVGSLESRSSSLTHDTPSDAPRESSLSSLYPEFIRKRVTPARHDVVAEEVDKELLLNATDFRTPHYDSTGLSAAIRVFLKLQQETGDKAEPWTRLDEMA